MNRYLRLFRIGNCLMGIVALALASFMAIGTSIADHLQELAIAGGVVFLFIAGGNSLNDYTDREVDREAHPDRPIPSGEISPRDVLILSGMAFVLAIAASLLLDIVSTVIVLGAVALMILYEAGTKRMGLIGNISIAVMTAGLFVLGGAVVGDWQANLAVAGLAGLATLGREIVKDIEDMEGDVDRRTLPKVIGKRNAGVVAAVLFILAVALSLTPYLQGTLDEKYVLVVLVADAIFIYCSAIQFQDPRRGQSLAKYGMLVALIAFLVGGIR